MIDSNTITLNSSIQRIDDIITNKFQEEVVMMSMESSKYYGLNSVGSRIWELLADNMTVSQLCSVLGTEFGVEQQQCHNDVLEFLNMLLSKNLIKTNHS